VTTLAIAVTFLLAGWAAFLWAERRQRRAKPAKAAMRPSAGPYRVAGERTIATVNCSVRVGFDPAKLAALTPEQRERVTAAIIGEAILIVSGGGIADQIRQKIAAVVADAENGVIDGDLVSPRNHAESHVSE